VRAFFHACAVIFHFHLNVNSDHKNRSTNFLLREIKNESEKRFPALKEDSKESMHGNSACCSIAFDNYARRNALGADLIAGPLAYRLRAPKRQRKSGHTGYVFVTGVGLKRPTRRWRDAQKPQIFLGSFGWLDEATGLKTGRLGFVGILGLLAAWCLWGAVTRRATVKHGRVLGPAVRVFLELLPGSLPAVGA